MKYYLFKVKYESLCRLNNDQYEEYTYKYGREDSGHWEINNDIKSENIIRELTEKEAKSKIAEIDDYAYDDYHESYYSYQTSDGQTHSVYTYQDYIDRD